MDDKIGRTLADLVPLLYRTFVRVSTIFRTFVRILPFQQIEVIFYGQHQ